MSTNYDITQMKGRNTMETYIKWKNKRHWYDVRDVLSYNALYNFIIMINFRLARYKVYYTRGDTKYYSYCSQVSTRKLISEHGKKHMITSIIDMNTDEEIWNK